MTIFSVPTPGWKFDRRLSFERRLRPDRAAGFQRIVARRRAFDE